MLTDADLLFIPPNELTESESNRLLVKLRDPDFYKRYHSTFQYSSRGMFEKMKEEQERRFEEVMEKTNQRNFLEEMKQGGLDEQLLMELETQYINGFDLEKLIDKKKLLVEGDIERIAAVDRLEDIVLSTPPQEMTGALSAVESLLLQKDSFQRKKQALMAKTFADSMSD
jgi:hypothetical protein